MSEFDALVKFACEENGRVYFATISTDQDGKARIPKPGSKVDGYASIGDLREGRDATTVTIKNLLGPLPSIDVPIYCVGLNYRSHAKEANLPLPKYPPLWTKPASSLADPGESIPINKFCALSLFDFEGELVFVTSKACKDVTPEEAESYILGYTSGNDLSCRYFQLPNNSGGQFFYAKAFDRFAPMGPALISADHFRATGAGRRLITRVNGKIVQDVEIAKDMLFTPAQILSHMSQGTTIPAGTAVMTGTPAGVGAFQSPKSFLNDGDVIEVEIDQLETLRNVVRFEK
ncbi:hypothetical protein M409DRAFT_66679 [Zasmidium cellare ATCC 36951]|uniref:Fumarylacetoacetase-like C-terminal domain-containing protein n=1 Tax=Zasmidium cellare ATCC 36951 TaxID=1080233 RepID=A0A6A6CIZ3_ZASCE|nr:uncharacterized protein M409DRAFT_66679 [Zasmidium cellare ATCC 36951]KAF2166170.1 hypothetical protein M409DRAFT_66679 [Zasmidium cellare ATCC 36951]